MLVSNMKNSMTKIHSIIKQKQEKQWRPESTNAPQRCGVKLGINIDHVATLRQQRREGHPDPVVAALVCEKAGADGITAHLREYRRHIDDSDILTLKRVLNTKLNMEMSVSPDIVKLALKVVPDDVCIVPEKRKELTTEGGLDVFSQKKQLAGIIKQLNSKNIVVSLFIDPGPKTGTGCKGSWRCLRRTPYRRVRDSFRYKERFGGTKEAKGSGKARIVVRIDTECRTWA